MNLQSVELCAGAGGQALGLEQAGFEHKALIEIDPHACRTLKANRPEWNVFEGDLREAVDGNLIGFSPKSFKGIDLIAGGVPCPPFSLAGKQLGGDDERDLFPAALHLVDICRPRAVMLENVRGILGAKFDDYRSDLNRQFEKLGYIAEWKLLHASDFGVPQLRPRAIVVAIERRYAGAFKFPEVQGVRQRTVGKTLFSLMSSRGWRGAEKWRDRANNIAPTLVGGSKKHGGPDLGPTRAKQAWASLGVDAHGLANDVPEKDFVGMPRLTVSMAALLQGFPKDWQFTGGKTAAYRQVGNAFPPPVARAVASQILIALERASSGYLKKTA